MVYVYAALALWTIVSVWWFLTNIGNKHGKNPWWVWLIAIPVMVICLVIGLIGLVVEVAVGILDYLLGDADSIRRA